jgi:hypothetical protein
MSDPIPTYTPNVIVENPTVRKVVGNALGVASLLLAVGTLVDGAIAELDYAFVTGPAAVIVAGLFGIFQLGVTSPNVPR